MKRTIMAATLIANQVATGGLSADSNPNCQEPSKTLLPQEVAQAQLDAYNARDIDAFTACYSANLQVFEHPDRLLLEGQEAFRARYEKTFEFLDLKAVVNNRMTVGETVIDKEVVTRGGETISLIAIYHVLPKTGKIDKVWFIR